MKEINELIVGAKVSAGLSIQQQTCLNDRQCNDQNWPPATPLPVNRNPRRYIVHCKTRGALAFATMPEFRTPEAVGSCLVVDCPIAQTWPDPK